MSASSGVVGDRVTVAFCIATYKRPAGLARLLQSVTKVVIPNGVSPKLIVVDNDPEGSAQDIVEQARTDITWPVSYVVESRQGIPHARNRSIAEAGAADYVAFLDDDEELDSNWLTTVLEAQREYDADVVFCPVFPEFESTPPAWVIDGRFFDRARFTTGATVPVWATDTGSSFLRRSVFRNGTRAFDDRFLTGSDRLFFTKLQRDGGKFVWADDTWIREHLPPSRSTGRWLVRRAYRNGNVRSLVTLAVDEPGLGRRLRRALFGASRIVLGAFQAVVGVFGGRHRVMEGVRKIAHGAGLITGIAGVSYNEYRVVHGS